MENGRMMWWVELVIAYIQQLEQDTKIWLRTVDSRAKIPIMMLLLWNMSSDRYKVTSDIMD
jgi:hypothetical protein